jgi:hypothetical protein
MTSSANNEPLGTSRRSYRRRNLAAKIFQVAKDYRHPHLPSPRRVSAQPRSHQEERVYVLVIGLPQRQRVEV